MVTMLAIQPIEHALTTLWPDAKPSGNNGWYSAHCTGHNDTSPSLGIIENEDGSIGLHCQAGCTREMIIAGAHTTEKALRVKGSYRPKYTPRPKYDLFSLAHNKLLPWQFLFNEHVEDGYKWHSTDCVAITYYDFAGDAHPKIRLRVGPSGNKDSRWDEDTPGTLIPYGYQWLDLARQKGYVLLGEGESDGWTCRYHDIPYIGVPGANNTKVLDGSLLNDIPALYVIQEPDTAGQGFYKSVHKRLRETGYTGAMFALPWQKLTGWKDPNELHRMIRIADPNDTHAGFQAKITEVLERAIPAGDDISLDVSEMNATEWVSRAAYDELKEQYHEVKAQRDFMLQVIAVPKEILKETDKIVNIVIDDELRQHAANEKGFIPIRMTDVEKRTGVSYDTVGRSKARLEKVLDLYEQDTVKHFSIGPDGETSQRNSIFLRPRQKQQFPRLYSTDDPIKWGGSKPGRQPRVCPECKSLNVDVVETTICHCCHKNSFEETYTSPVPLYEGTPTFYPPFPAEEEPIIVDADVPTDATEDANSVVQTGIHQVAVGINKILLPQLDVPSRDIHEKPDTIVNPSYSTRLCSRCGRVGEIERNPGTGLLACICYQEDYETAARGKVGRTTPVQMEISA